MTQLQKLPLDTQAFSTIRQENYLYADKTEYIHRMLQTFRYVFLSRPRRFGKSLILSTIEELFLGHKELFDGLWIERAGYNFKKYPVITLNMTMENKSTDLLEAGIISRLKNIAKREKLEVTESIPGEALTQLIEDLHTKYNEKVVVLIDEYDKPILDCLHDLELANANRAALRSFYVVLKDLDAKLQFVFITGVTKFVQTAIASAFNNLVDITLEPDFAGVCGFTMDDFDTHFIPRLPDLLEKMNKSGKFNQPFTVSDLRKQILDWYDGYSWTGIDRVLNPFSILRFFTAGRFQNYWYDTGSPFFLTTLVKHNPASFFQNKLDDYLRTELEKTELGQIAPVPLLFQTGYLTVDKTRMIETTRIKAGIPFTTLEEAFTFKTPNLEVDDAYREAMVRGLYNLQNINLDEFKENYATALLSEDVTELEKIIGAVFAKINYHQKAPDEFKKERHFHSALQAFMIGLNLDVRSEVTSAKGRSDLEVVLPDDVYVIIELKYASATTKADTDAEEKQALLLKKADEALEQIRKNNYARQHQLKAKKIIEMGLSIYGSGEVMVKFGE